MSYILDALKKSEAERKKALRPGKERLALADEAPARPPYAAWAGIGFALAALLAAGAYLLGQRQAPAPAPPVAETVPQLPAKPQPQPEPTVVTAAETPAAIKAGEAEPSAEAPPEPPAPKRSILRFADLPSRLQAKVPDLKVSSHLYSSDPGDRMATINGTPRREGADLGGGLRLVEVTASGVLLEIEGRLFALDILEEWNRETTR